MNIQMKAEKFCFQMEPFWRVKYITTLEAKLALLIQVTYSPIIYRGWVGTKDQIGSQRWVVRVFGGVVLPKVYM